MGIWVATGFPELSKEPATYGCPQGLCSLVGMGPPQSMRAHCQWVLTFEDVWSSLPPWEALFTSHRPQTVSTTAPNMQEKVDWSCRNGIGLSTHRVLYKVGPGPSSWNPQEIWGTQSPRSCPTPIDSKMNRTGAQECAFLTNFKGNSYV